MVKFAGLDPSYPHDESDKMQYYTLDLRDVDAAVHETTVKETTAKDVTPTSPWRFICLAGPSYTGREREKRFRVYREAPGFRPGPCELHWYNMSTESDEIGPRRWGSTLAVSGYLDWEVVANCS